MSNKLKVTGIVLSEFPLGESDKRLTILTKEMGKIPVIAKGCRKATSRLHAISQALTAGHFEISAGRQYNYLNSGECMDTFGYVKDDLDRILYSTYFAEVTEYFAVEGQKEVHMLNLLWVTFSAMKKQLIPLSMIRRIFEFKILQYAGMGMECFVCTGCGSEENLTAVSPLRGGVLCARCADGNRGHPVSPEVIHALQYTAWADLTKVYSFSLKEEVRIDYEWIIGRFFTVQADHHFRSSDMLDMLH